MGLATWDGSAWVDAGEYDSQICNANETAAGDFPAAVAWVGTAVAVLAGPTHVLLAHDGHVGVVVPVAGVLASAAGLWLVRTLWRSPPSRSAA